MRVLIVNEPGYFIGVKGEKIQVRKVGKVIAEIPIIQLSTVYLATRGASLSVAALRLFLRNGVNLIVLDGYGRPIGRLQPFIRLGLRTVDEQISALMDNRGLILAKAFATAKIYNQSSLIRSASYNRRETSPQLAEKLLEISKGLRLYIEKINKVDGYLDGARPEIIRLEAEAAERYWSGFSLLLQEYNIDFPGRRKRFENPSDPGNLLLNYGYGLLVSRCLHALEMSGLDPFRGFLHVNSSRRPALAMDLMEEFRQPVVDRAVLRVLREIGERALDSSRRISREGRRAIIESVTERLRQRVTFRERSLPIETHILLQARRIALYLIGKSEGYVGFSER